jgi:hypothetical protein
MSTFSSQPQFAIDLIRQSNLLDYEEVTKFLHSRDEAKAKRALDLMVSERLAYSKADIEPLTKLVHLVWGFFPESPAILEKGTFSKYKEKWQCACGSKMELEFSRCHSCSGDRRGFKPSEISASYVIDLLNRRIEVLKELFEKSPE